MIKLSQTAWRTLVVAGVVLSTSLLFAEPFTAELSSGEVSLKLAMLPARVDLSQDLILTLTVEAPAHLTVTLPDLRERFAGFSTAEDFSLEPVEIQGKKQQLFRWRLVPEPAAKRYRLAPFAVTVADTASPAAEVRSFATRPVIFPAPIAGELVTGEVEVDPSPIFVRPTVRTVTFWVLQLLGGILLLAGLVILLLWLARRVKEVRLSPSERAMVELQRLVKRDLPGRQLFKEFYIELTMVVRRYIERTRSIRAPGQTTQEFLIAASNHPSFKPEAVSYLKEFLESADLIKFAGQQANVTMTTESTERAREYIDNDQPPEVTR